MFSKKSSEDKRKRCHIPVYVRVRPQLEEEGVDAICLDRGRLVVQTLEEEKTKNISFTFAKNIIFGSDQISAFQTLTEDLTMKLLDGYSCTLIAYGQTGSGKTYTMFGPPGCLTETVLAQAGRGVPATWGIFPRLCMNLLAESRDDCRYTLSASAIEIYQDDAFDLLNESVKLVIGKEEIKEAHDPRCCCKLCSSIKKASKSMKVTERDTTAFSDAETLGSEKRGTSFCTVGERIVSINSPNDIARLARTVELSRTAYGHALNARSSRSHCIVCVYINKVEPLVKSSEASKVTKQQFYFVDLAGSERIYKSGVIGQRRQEATAINQSLSALGHLILKLGRGEKHIPYRNSTLTMLLKSSFEGRSFTSVIINVSAEAQHVKETISSLRFGESMTDVVSSVSRSATAVVKESETELELTRKQDLLQEKMTQLADMERRGLGGKFSPSVVPSEKNTFLQNVTRMEIAKKKVSELKIGLAEAKMSGVSSEDDIVRAESALARAQHLYRVAFEIVEREKMIPNFWTPPADSYVALEREIAALTINR